MCFGCKGNVTFKGGFGIDRVVHAGFVYTRGGFSDGLNVNLLYRYYDWLAIVSWLVFKFD